MTPACTELGSTAPQANLLEKKRKRNKDKEKDLEEGGGSIAASDDSSRPPLHLLLQHLAGALVDGESPVDHRIGLRRV